jgi:hypothetical protein
MMRVAAIGGRSCCAIRGVRRCNQAALPQLSAGPQYKNPSEMSQRKALKNGHFRSVSPHIQKQWMSTFVSRTQWAGRVNAREQTCGEFDRGALG